MIFTTHNLFLLGKFFAESCLLAWMILLVFPKKAKRRLWLLPLLLLSAVIQLAAHVGLSALSFAQDTFILRYVLFMGIFGMAAACIFTRAERGAAFSAVFHFLVSAVIAQFLGTQTVFCSFGYQAISTFDLRMQFLSALVTIAMMLLSLGFCFCYRKKLSLLADRQLLLSDLCSLAFLLLAVLFNQFFCATTEYRIAAILLLVGLFLLHFLVLALLIRIAEEHREKMDSLRLGQQQELQMQYMRELNSLYDGMRALRHEYHNHATYLKYLLDHEKYGEMAEYLQRFDEPENRYFRFFDTGNKLVDAILSTKIGFAEAQNIPVRVRANLPETLAVDGGSLCCVLSNLLDNAIEASLHEAEPEITVQLQLQKNYLVILISNRIADDVLKKNPELHSSKKDLEQHGYGLKNVRNSIRRCSGMIRMDCEDGRFIVTATMQNTAEPQ